MKKRRILIAGLSLLLGFGGFLNHLYSSLDYRTQVKRAINDNDYEVAYTLSPTKGSNNSYAGNCDITVGGITWNLTGNSQQDYWRIGGKSITSVDRALYSKTAITSDITAIRLSLGAMSSITLNSITLQIASDADFGTIVKTFTVTSGIVADKDYDFEIGTGTWTNCFYKFVFNVTVSGSSNKFVEFKGATFYKTKGAAPSTQHTVTFYDGENVLSSVNVVEGAKVAKPADPVKDLYTFVNWYADVGLNTLFNFDTPINTDTNIYAKFTATAAETDYANGWETNHYYRVYGEVTAITNASNAYIQYEDKALLLYQSSISSLLSVGEEVELTGKYTVYKGENELSDLTIEDRSGDETIETAPLTKTSDVTAANSQRYVSLAKVKLGAETATGFEIVGEDFEIYYNNNSIYTISPNNYELTTGDYVSITGIIVHTDKDELQIKPQVITHVEVSQYTVTFDANGGSAVDAIKVEEGGSIAEAPTTTRPNANNKKYTFLGWYTPLDVLVTFPYTPTANITLTAKWEEHEMTAKELLEEKNTAASLYYQYQKSNKTDSLNRGFTTIADGSGYDDWTATTTNNVTYVGSTAGNNNSIQLRSTNQSGIVTTTSIGKAKKVTVVWNSNTTSGRTLDIYGSNTAYENADDLYGSSKGTKLGSIVKGTSTELTITGDYYYIGIRSNSGALFLNSITIDWDSSQIDQAAIRYGAVIEKDLYDQLGTVTDYGVILGSEKGIASANAKSLKDFYNNYHENDQFEKFKEDAKIRDFNYVVASDPMPTAKEEQLSILGITGPAYLFNVFVDLTAHLTTDIYALSYVTVGGERIFLQEVHYSVKSIAQKYINEVDGLDATSYEGSLGYLAIL